LTQFVFTLAVTFGAGLVMLLLLRRLPTLRLQLAGLALLAVALPLATVLLSGVAMFHMHEDLKLLFLAAGAASSATFAALALTRSIGGRIHALRTAAQQLAAGDLQARAPVRGPAELAALGRAFNEMAADLEQLFDARRQLVAAASHDLRTPIAAIEAMHEAIEDGLVEPDYYLPSLRQQARRLHLLIDDLFELARIDAGSLAFELREAQLEALVESSLRAFEAQASLRHIRLDAKLERPLPPIRCAPDQIERVLANVLTNALRHTPADGSVAVVAEPVGNELRIHVEDDGSGLSPEALQRMFDHFWRDDPARGPQAGAGLGLAIAKGLVEAHGGRIWAENRAEGGARVSFSLPVAVR
jgi:two-component system, OmpR family, sensor histidine kinase SaeS